MEKTDKNRIDGFLRTYSKPALIGATVLCAAAGLFSFFQPRPFTGAENDPVGNAVKLAFQDVIPGTTVSYDIFSGPNIVTSGREKVGSTGHVKMIVPRTARSGEDSDTLTYKVRVDRPEGNKTPKTNPLTLLLKVHQKTGDVTFSGSGLKEFSDVTVTRGEDAHTVKSDWAGSFSETVTDDQTAKTGENLVKLAFQSYNLASDASSAPAIVNIAYTHLPFGTTSGGDIPAAQESLQTALIMMTQQLTVTMAMQVSIIGTLLDAKNQLEVQRKMQELQARAHKDYHPSEQICRLGTFVRSLAGTETKMEITKHGLNRILMDQYLAVENNHTAQGPKVGAEVMRNQYISTYCDRRDNNDSLDRICTATDSERFNKDLDFTRTLDFPLTLDIDFLTGGAATEDEEDIIALAQNLYMAQMFEEADLEHVKDDPRLHYRTRSYAAKMGVAHNSFINLVAMKSRSPDGVGAESGWNYMKALLREFGITSDSDINAYMGDYPSYYAQMEILAKKIYQHPNFYTNLMDKPVNVDRIGIALDAITLMNERDRYESSLRREMLTSVLLEQALDRHVEEVTVSILQDMKDNPKGNN